MKEIKDAIGFGLAVGGLLTWFFPQFNGIFSDTLALSVGEGRLIASVWFVGGVIIYFMPTDKE